jgi:hypothetical protein
MLSDEILYIFLRSWQSRAVIFQKDAKTMRHFYMLPLLTGPISFIFMGVATHAGAFDQSPAPAQNIVTLEKYKDALPETSEELDLAGFLALKDKGAVTVLDVRSAESYASRHLAGSLNAPLTDLTEKNLPALAPDKDAPVVLVCDFSFFPTRMVSMTLQAYPVLKSQGYKNIYRLNLWQGKNGGGMVSQEDQEKALAFEGSDVRPAKQ